MCERDTLQNIIEELKNENSEYTSQVKERDDEISNLVKSNNELQISVAKVREERNSAILSQYEKEDHLISKMNELKNAFASFAIEHPSLYRLLDKEKKVRKIFQS